MQLLLSILGGTLLGGSIVWFILTAKLQTIREKTKNDLIAERASIVEQLRNKDQRLEELKKEIADRDRTLTTTQTQLTQAHTQTARLETQLSELQQQTAEKISLLTTAQDRAQQQLTDTFKALSSQALQENNQSFLKLAEANLSKFQTAATGELTLKQQAIEEVVSPLKSSLTKVETYLQSLENKRVSAYSQLTEQISSLASSQSQLQKETANLAKALRSPTVRGRWGELQLKRVVELAGMSEHCDFTQQVTKVDGLRPDMLIQLPGQRQIIVDAKAPLSSYLSSLEAVDESDRTQKLQSHAKQVRRHLTQLSQKAYWQQFQPTPEFVVLFLPGEIFFSAALEQDPSLIESGIEQRVILATPTTLIALLKAVSYGWQQEKVTENAKEISRLGQELYDRTRTFAKHMQKMRKGLDTTVDSFNKAVGSLESRVLVSARKLQTLGAGSGDDIDSIQSLEKMPRLLQQEITEEATAD